MKKTSDKRKRKRILSVHDSIVARLKETHPSLQFEAKNVGEWREWRRKFEKVIWQELGTMPKRAPLQPEILERKDMGDYIREKVVFDSEPFASIPAWVLVPKQRKRKEKLPAVLCSHGHGLGKNELVGLDNKGRRLATYQKESAVQFARRGYVTISPDWRAFGERTSPAPGDICDKSYMGYLYLGFHLLALQIWDGMRTIDYLQSRPEVDPSRIGCQGVSLGGTMTIYLTALDPRIKVACIHGYICNVRYKLKEGWGVCCGSQTMPSLLKYGDVADVAILIAPRPLLVTIGKYDSTFPAPDALSAYRRIKKAYEIIGKKDYIQLDLFDGVHEFSNNKIFKWFDRWLKNRGKV